MAFHCISRLTLAIGLLTFFSACESLDRLPTAKLVFGVEALDTTYRIGSNDSLQIFVWRNPELSTSVSVRPDGKITIPLIEDMPVAGKTTTELARDLEKKLAVYVQDPIVSVITRGGVGPFEDRVRIVGEASRPQALPYRAPMTLLDVMISVGGITDFAAGNRAVLNRIEGDKLKQYSVLIDDLLRNGDMSANVRIQPGDIIIIPEAWF